MRVLHMNTSLDKGGAAKSVIELSNGINKYNSMFESKVLSGYSEFNKGNGNNEYIYRKFYKYMNAFFTRVSGLDSLMYPFQKKKFIRSEIKKYDIIHFHNLHGYYIDYRWLLYELIKMSKPVVWTLRDYWLATGRCAFPSNCQGFKKECKKCNHLDKYPRSFFFDFANYMFKEKRNVINEFDNINFITISNKSKNFFSETWLQNKNIRVIHNGFDLSKYTGVSENNVDGKFNILFIASDCMDERKGLIYLLKSLKKIQNKEDIVLHILGDKAKEGFLDPFINLEQVIQYGYVKDEKKLERIFNKSNVFINPSLDETFGRTSIEALLYGLPVIAFDIPIMREVLGDVGLFAERKNSDDLKNKICLIKKYWENNELNYKIYKERGKKFSKSKMIKEHIKLYKSIL